MKRRLLGQKVNESGFASIVIAMVLILVLSLMTVGFAQLMRNEQNSALNKQLSSQAYYAAETGVNDAAKAVNAGFSVAKTTCGYTTAQIQALSGTNQTAAEEYLASDTIGASTNASYPCLLINPTPLQLMFSDIDTNDSKVVELSGLNPATNNLQLINSLNISWQPDSTNSSSGQPLFVPGNGNNFYPSSASGYSGTTWPATGVLRISLTPLGSGHINRTDLITSTYVAFLYPNATSSNASTPTTLPTYLDNITYTNGNAATVTINDQSNGPILDGDCSTGNTPMYCNVQITGLNQANYLLVMNSIYSPNSVTVTAEGPSNTPLDIGNAQTLIDSTGEAQGVLRRIQVRLSDRPNYDIPNGTEATEGICKQLAVAPNIATTDPCNPTL
jgi:hypothetical protein